MSTRNDKLDEMNNQLHILQQQLVDFTNLSKQSVQQFESIKKFGVQQSSFFISSHSVFQKINEEKENKD